MTIQNTPVYSEKAVKALREMGEGAPRTIRRMADSSGQARTTLSGYATRGGWLKPKLQKADNCWKRGDLAGSLVEEAVAMAEAGDLPLARLRRRMDRCVAQRLGLPAGDDDEAARAPSDLPAENVPHVELAAGDTLETAEPRSLEEQFLRLGKVLSRQIGMFIALVDRAGGRMAKSDVDALSVLLRLAERLDALAEQHAAEHQKRSDDEVAGILERVDERIVELAHAHAERLGREEFHE